MSLGPLEIGLIAVVVLLMFGPSRLPGLGKSVGEAIRGFKKGLNTDEIDVTESSQKAEELTQAQRNAANAEQKEKDTTKS